MQQHAHRVWQEGVVVGCIIGIAVLIVMVLVLVLVYNVSLEFVAFGD